MDIIEESKAALKEIHEFFKANIENGTLVNEGFNDGLSKQYTFMDLSVVVSLNPETGKAEQHTYYGVGENESFAEVFPDNSTNLDNEFNDEIDKVMQMHFDFRNNLRIHNQAAKKSTTSKLRR